MSANATCPICNWKLDEKAVSVTVGGTVYRVCCDDCAKEAVANPSRLAAPLVAGRKV